ncbi:MAG TPA: FAD binding domain-containing protein [Methylomirabilota bacterium]|nr:FAD binding domain-containing protein [Methylomirabilota bacterium]
MKPAPFRYARPATAAEAVALLASAPGEAKLLAGGQSLMPLLNMRLARPAVLVDVNGLGELARIEPGPDGGLVVGALVRHSDLAASPLVRERAPLLAAAARHVGHTAIRNRGTLGGSLAHADPAAELPAAVLALDAAVGLLGPRGMRRVAAADFFRGLLSTALAADELLARVIVPAAPPGWGFAEMARRPGDFALAGVAVTLGARGHARIVGFGLADRPLRLRGAEALAAAAPRDPTMPARAGAAAGADCDPATDVHASAEYRRHLATVLTEDALREAVGRLGS